MGYKTSDTWDDRRKILTRVVIWDGNAGAFDLLPTNFDDKWRYISYFVCRWAKTSVVAVGSIDLRLDQESLVEFPPIYQRSMEAAAITADPAFLQAGEQQCQANTQFIATPAQITPNGIILPPRSRLSMFVDSTITAEVYLIMHEAFVLKDLAGIIG